MRYMTNNYHRTMATILALGVGISLADCVGTDDGTEEPSPTQDDNDEGGKEDGAARADVTPAGTVLIAFDGTGNHIEQNNVIAQAFKNIQTTGGQPKELSFKAQAQAAGARGAQPWAYKSYVRNDAQGRARSIYYNGAPEGPTNLSPGFEDSGARFAFDHAFAGGFNSPVCKAIRDSSTKKVFFIGYSRGGVLAHAAAATVLKGACGAGMSAKVTWVGLVDPVHSGMKEPYRLLADCDADASQFSVYDDARTFGCLSLLRNFSSAAPIPVGVFMKDTAANIAAHPFLLSTVPVNGAKVKTFDLPGTATSVHIDMGGAASVYNALKADGRARGGLQFAK
jgi:hypothetical protein